MPGTDNPSPASKERSGPSKYISPAAKWLAAAFLGLLIAALAAFGQWLQLLIVGVAAAGLGLAALALGWMHWPFRRALLRILLPTALLTAGIVAWAIMLDDPADVRWYVESSNGQPELAQTDTLRIEDDWVGEAEATIPVRIAIGNKGRKTLKSVTVQIGYPAGYNVIPQGNQRLDTDKHLLIYQHELDDVYVRGDTSCLSNPMSSCSQ
jgi:hypothetical protein